MPGREFTMPGRILDTPTPVTREHKLFQKAKRRHDNKPLVKFSEETLNADTDPITGISTPNDNNLQEISKEGKRHKRKKNKSKKRNGKNKVSQQDDIQHNEGVASQLWDL